MTSDVRMSQSFSYVRKYLGELFTDSKIYRVPEYQRSYAWEKETVEDFWGDILDAMKQQLHQYFMGTLVLIPIKSTIGHEYEVVDGQQRLCTMLILFAALRDELVNEDDEIAKFICGKLDSKIYHVPRKEKKYERVRLNRHDDRFFKKHIIGESHLDLKAQAATHDSNKRLLYAYTYLRQKARAMINKEGVEFLLDYYNFFTQKAMVITIEVLDDSDAHHIFESINAKGVPLKPMDLIKNLLISKVQRENRSDITAKWDSISSKFSESQAFRFFRYYWMSKYELLRKKGFYRRIKKVVTEELDPEELIDDLEEHSEYYYRILEPTRNSYEEGSYNALAALKTLGVTQVHPLLLAAAARFGLNSSQFGKISEALLSFVMRKFIIGTSSPNEFEIDAGKLARELREKKITTQGLISNLRNSAPNDKVFMHEFSKAKIKSSRTAKYILRQINGSYSRTQEIVVGKKVHLEHILPQSPTESWYVSFEKHDEDTNNWIDRIGNLTLLDEKLNRKVSNKSFADKKRKYKMSEIKMTKQLCANDSWGPREIEKRQKAFAKRAVGIWPL